MAERVTIKGPVSLMLTEIGSLKPLPFNDWNTIEGIKAHRVAPAVRNNQGALSTGNFVQKDRLTGGRQYLSPTDLANGVSNPRDCELRELVEGGAAVDHITPILSQGGYSIGSRDYYLYGDDSVTGTIPVSSTAGGLTDNVDPRSPVTVGIWTRNSCNAAVLHKQALMVGSFSGELLTECTGRDAVVNSTILHEIMWNNAIGSPTYELNQLLEEEFFADYVTVTKLEASVKGDIVGKGTGKSCQRFYTKFFPLDDSGATTIQVASYLTPDDDRSDFNGWTRVSDFTGSSETDLHYTLDADLGIITLGGQRGTGGVLRVKLLDTETRIVEVVDTDGLPDVGTIRFTFGAVTEDITYDGKTETALLNITRGTTPLDWAAGVGFSVPVTGAVLEEGHTLVAFYKAIPRIDYGEYFEKGGSDLALRVSDISPYQLSNNEGILVLDRCNYEIGSVTLRPVDLDSIVLNGDECYGPVYPGETTVVIEVTVLSTGGVPIPNSEVLVTVNGPGTLNYLDQVTIITNAEGRGYVTYVPGDDAVQKMYARSAEVTQDTVAGTTDIDFSYMTDLRLNPSDLNLISLYSITKDDPSIGSVGLMHTIDWTNYALHADVGSFVGAPFSNVAPTASYLTDNNLADGFVVIGKRELRETDRWNPEVIDGELVYATATFGYSLTPGEGSVAGTVTVPIDRIYQASELFTSDPVTGGLMNVNIWEHTYVVGLTETLPFSGGIQYVQLRTARDVAWDGDQLNGRLNVTRTLVGDATLDPQNTPGLWLHPSSDSITTVYKPVTPSEYMGSNVLRFNGLLPLPEENNNLNNLGGYAIYGQIKTVIEASARDPKCKNVATTSDPLCLYLSLADSSNGTIGLGTEYVPYGFRLVSDTYDGASRLDRATYLTVNKTLRVSNSTPYKVPLISEISTGGTLSYNDTDDVYNSIPTGVNFTITVTA